MALWEWLLDGLGLLLLLVVVYGAALIVRRRLIARHGGTFELSHRVRTHRVGRGWVLGVGRYHGQTLEWFRIFSLSPRPKTAWRRDELEYVGRREMIGAETISLYAGTKIVVCQSRAGEIELAMSPSSLMGFQAWLEARPPGASWGPVA